MNREIKFRAWHTEAETMLQVGDNFNTTHELDCCRYYIEGQPVILMQYTGLKDRNGKEIYEGDILLTPAGIMKVIFDNGCFYNDSKYMLGSWNQRDIEVVGNIFENPELLK